jgi:hypothetical protein
MGQVSLEAAASLAAAISARVHTRPAIAEGHEEREDPPSAAEGSSAWAAAACVEEVGGNGGGGEVEEDEWGWFEPFLVYDDATEDGAKTARAAPLEGGRRGAGPCVSVPTAATAAAAERWPSRAGGSAGGPLRGLGLLGRYERGGDSVGKRLACDFGRLKAHSSGSLPWTSCLGAT